MGQAKLRGSFEDRKMQALQRSAYEKKALQERIAREAQMTAAQRQRRIHAQALIAALGGIGLAFEMSKQPDA